MNIKDLANIDINDLKNIDLNDIKLRILSRPDILIDIILIGITIYVTIFIYSGNELKKVSLNKNIKEMEEKLNVVVDLKSANETYKKFKEDFPESLTSEQIVDRISVFGVNNNIQIQSFSPAKEQKSKYITLTTVQINVVAANYENIISFMKDIETAPYALRVESWNGSMASQGRRETTASNDSINADIMIGSIKLNDDIK